MKKILCIFCAIVMLAVWVTGCEKKTDEPTAATTELEEGCVRYEFIKWQIDQQVQDYATVSQVTGNKDLYLKLYDDGTAKMCVTTEVKDMQYAGGMIWLVEEPNNKMVLALDGNVVTITDGAYVFYFAAK